MTSRHSIVNSPQHSKHESIQEAGWSDDEVYDSDYEPEQYSRNYLNNSASCTVVQVEPKSSQISTIISQLNAGNSRGFRVVVETDNEESEDEEDETSGHGDDASISSFDNRDYGNQCDSEEEKEIDFKTSGYRSDQPIETIVIEDDEETEEEETKVDLITTGYEGDAVTSSLATLAKHHDRQSEVEDNQLTDKAEEEVGAIISAYHGGESVLPCRTIPHKESDFIGYDLVEMEENYEKEKSIAVECFKCYDDAPLFSVGSILPLDDQHVTPEVRTVQELIDSSHPLIDYKAEGDVTPVDIRGSHDRSPMFSDINSVVVPEPTCVIPEPECIIPDEIFKPDSTFESLLVKMKSEVSESYIEEENESRTQSQEDSLHCKNNGPEAILSVSDSQVTDVERFKNDVKLEGVNSSVQPTLVLKKTELLLETSNRDSLDTQNQVHIPFGKSETNKNMDNGRLKKVLDKMASIYLDRYTVELKKFYHNDINFDDNQEYQESSLTLQLEKIRTRVKRNMRRKNQEALSHRRNEFRKNIVCPNSLVHYPFSHGENESCDPDNLESIKNTGRSGCKTNLKNLISIEKSIFEEMEVEIDEKYPAIIQNLLENSSRRFSKESENAEEFETTVSDNDSRQNLSEDCCDRIINLDSIKKEITDKLEVQVEEKYPQYIDLLEDRKNTFGHLTQDKHTSNSINLQCIKQDILNQIQSQINEICFKSKNENQVQPYEKSLVETISSQIYQIFPLLLKDSTGNMHPEKNKTMLDNFKKSILEKVRLGIDHYRKQSELIRPEDHINTDHYTKSILDTMQVQIDEKYPEIIRNLMVSREISVNDNDTSDSDAESSSCLSSGCSRSSCSSSSSSQDSSSSSEDEQDGTKRNEKEAGYERKTRLSIKKEWRENSTSKQNETNPSADIAPTHVEPSCHHVTVIPADNSTQCIIHPAISQLVVEKEGTEANKEGTDADKGTDANKGIDADKGTDADIETDADKEGTDADKNSVSDRDVETLNAVQFILDMDNAAVEKESETVGEPRVFENPPELPPPPRPDSPDTDNNKKKKGRKQRFRCEKCRKSFILEKNLHKHHCRQFKCKGCSQAYETLEKTSEHEQTCLLFKKRQGLFCKDCKMTFRTSLDFSLHQQVHSVLKSLRYKCSMCNSTFMHKTRLEHHIFRVHQPPRLVFCGFCNYSTTDFAALKRHYLRYHCDELTDSTPPAIHDQQQPALLYTPTNDNSCQDGKTTSQECVPSAPIGSKKKSSSIYRSELLKGNGYHKLKLFCDPCNCWFNVNWDKSCLEDSLKVSNCPGCGRKYSAKVVKRGCIVKPTIKPIELDDNSQDVLAFPGDRTDDDVMNCRLSGDRVDSNRFKTKVVTMPSGERMVAVLKPLASKQSNLDISKCIASSKLKNLSTIRGLTAGEKAVPDADNIHTLEMDSPSQPVEPQQDLFVHQMKGVFKNSSIVQCGNQIPTNYLQDFSTGVNNLESDSPDDSNVTAFYLPSEAPVTELDSPNEASVATLYVPTEAPVTELDSPNETTVAALYIQTGAPVTELDSSNETTVAALYIPTEAPVTELDSSNETTVAALYIPTEAPVTELDSSNETTVAALYIPTEAPVTKLDSPNEATVAELHVSTEAPVTELNLPNESIVALYLPTETPVTELDSLNGTSVTESDLPSKIANIEITLEGGEMQTFSSETLPVNSKGENFSIVNDTAASMPLSLEQLRFIMGNRVGHDKSEVMLIYKNRTDLNDCRESNVSMPDASNESDINMEDPLSELLIFKDKRFGQVYSNNRKGVPKSMNSLTPSTAHPPSSPWLCGKCGKSFKQVEDLKLHQLLNYMCHICKKEFDNIYQVRKHVNKEHLGEDKTTNPDDTITLPQLKPKSTNIQVPFALQAPVETVDLDPTEEDDDRQDTMKRRPLILRKRSKNKIQIFRHLQHVRGLSKVLKASHNIDRKGSLLQPRSSLTDSSLKPEKDPTDSSLRIKNDLTGSALQPENNMADSALQLETNRQKSFLESQGKQNDSPLKLQMGCKDLSDVSWSNQIVASCQPKSLGQESHLQTHEKQIRLSRKRPNNKNNLSLQVWKDALELKKKRCVQQAGKDLKQVLISLDFDLEEKSNKLHPNRFNTNNRMGTFWKGQIKLGCNDETCESESTSQDAKLLPHSNPSPDIRRSRRKRKYVSYCDNSGLEEEISLTRRSMSLLHNNSHSPKNIDDSMSNITVNSTVKCLNKHPNNLSTNLHLDQEDSRCTNATTSRSNPHVDGVETRQGIQRNIETTLLKKKISIGMEKIINIDDGCQWSVKKTAADYLSGWNDDSTAEGIIVIDSDDSNDNVTYSTDTTNSRSSENIISSNDNVMNSESDNNVNVDNSNDIDVQTSIDNDIFSSNDNTKCSSNDNALCSSYNS